MVTSESTAVLRESVNNLCRLLGGDMAFSNCIRCFVPSADL